MSLVLKIARRRWRTWLILAPLAFGALMARDLYLTPQTSAATTSLSIQQPGPVSSSTLAMLTGAGGSGKRYVGIIESRLLAETVARQINLFSLYPGRRADDIVSILNKATSVGEKHNDGLVYVTVQLPGPALLASDPSGLGRKIRMASADAANAYASALQQYYVTTDNDKESTLLREADTELHRARNEFDAATSKLVDFASGNDSLPAASLSALSSHASGSMLSSSSGASMMSPTSGASITLPSSGTSMLPSSSDGSRMSSRGGASMLSSPASVSSPLSPTDDRGRASEGLAAGLPAFYGALAQTETEIKSLEAARSAENRLVAGQLQDLNILPDEDPLLREARSNYSAALADLNNLKVLFGMKHPRVVAAEKRLRIAQEALRLKVEGVQRQRTTEDVRTAATLESLKAKRENLLRQIAEGERKFRLTSKAMAHFERLRNEVALCLEALKTTASETERLRLGTVSAQSRVLVVDTARPPRSGQPGLSRMAMTSLALLFLGLLAWVGLEYAAQTLRARTEPPPPIGYLPAQLEQP